MFLNFVIKGMYTVKKNKIGKKIKKYKPILLIDTNLKEISETTIVKKIMQNKYILKKS